MKLPTMLLAATLLATGLAAVAPAASATTCTADEPLPEPLVCGVILTPFCLGDNLGKYVASCVTRFLP